MTEHLSECARNTDPWNKQPRRMLRHRAIIQAIRVAFGFSAMDPEEADALQAATPANPGRPDFGPATVTSEPAPTTPAPQQEAPRRGRPPKSLPAVTNIETTVTRTEPPASTPDPTQQEQPQPEPTQPAPTTATKPAAPTAPTAVNYIKGVRGLLALEGITEGELLEFGRAEKGWDETLSSLEEIAMTSPSKLEQTYNEWGTFVKAIKGAKAAAAKVA